MTPTTFTESVAADLAPWAPAGSDFAAYTAALATMFEQVYGIVIPQGSPDDPANYTAGFSTLLDPTVCPDAFLPFCGQFIGVQIPPGTAPATARAQIIAEQNFQTGTTGGIISAAKLWLSGTQSVTLIERVQSDGTTPDAYHFVLIVLTAEVLDAGQLTAAVNAMKPVGVQWTLVQTSSWTITELEASAYTPISTTESTFPTISNLETDVI